MVAPAVGSATPAAAVPQPGDREITYHQWTTVKQFRTGGRLVGTHAIKGGLRIKKPVNTRTYRDPHGRNPRRYDVGRWVSRWQRPRHVFDELIPSWDAKTPGGTWVQIQIRGRSEAGKRSKWYTMANWAADDRRFHRTSHKRQADDLAEVNVDTLRARYSLGFTAWQMRVTLFRPAGTRQTPRVQTVGAMVSHVPSVDRVRTSKPGVARGISLQLPRYSQMIHEGHYPRYDGGGEAWCSPTSVSMVLGSLGRLPRPKRYSWVFRHRNRWVDHAARMQYDYRYEGAGNWSFSTAYAASRADAAFVTRLRNLREAERFIKAGIPLVASVRFGRGELSGAPISSTAGHLLVISGFTKGGDVIVHDPAAPKNASVVRTYDRGQFENAWVAGSGGVVYVIRNHDQKLPKSPTVNW